MEANTNSNAKAEKYDQNEEMEITPVNVAKWAHKKGLVPKQQVDAMQAFTDGKMDYATMRSLCG